METINAITRLVVVLIGILVVFAPVGLLEQVPVVGGILQSFHEDFPWVVAGFFVLVGLGALSVWLSTKREPQRRAKSVIGQSSEIMAAAQQTLAPTVRAHCPSCNHLLGEGAKFCSICGASVDLNPGPPTQLAAKATADSASRCPSCNQALRPGDKFCTGCGTQLESNETRYPKEVYP